MNNRKIRKVNAIWGNLWNYDEWVVMVAHFIVDDINAWKKFGIHTFGPFVKETR